MEGEAVSDHIWAVRCDVRHKMWVQFRYQRRRQRFWDLADKLTKSATILLGALLFGDWLRQRLPLAASAISGLSVLALIFGYTDRKQLHKELAEQAANLIASIEEVPANLLTSEMTSKWTADFTRYCMKVPPALKTLTVICEHEQATADGNPNFIQLPSIFRRCVAHFFS